MTPEKVVLYPFDEEYTDTPTTNDFRDWAAEHFEIFRHDLTTAIKGDTLIFCFKEEPGEWIMVGEAKVEFNHPIEKPAFDCEMCDDKSEENDEGFLRHISTSDYSPFGRNINTKEIEGIRLGRFAILDENQYAQLTNMV